MKNKLYLLDISFTSLDEQEEKEIPEFLHYLINFYLPNNYKCNSVHDFDRKYKLEKILKNINE